MSVARHEGWLCWRPAGVPACDDELAATTDGQSFRMAIEMIFTVTGRPGVHRGGEIVSGVVLVGDQLNLRDGGKLTSEVA